MPHPRRWLAFAAVMVVFVLATGLILVLDRLARRRAGGERS